MGSFSISLCFIKKENKKPKEKMVESEQSYEQIRLKRVEENKKRMEEFNLHKIAQSLRVFSSPAKPRTPRFPVEFAEVRRSSRAKNPPPSYRELGIEPLERPRRSYQRRDLLNRVYASDEARVYAIDRAEMLQSSLEQEFPSFVKPMLQSHVTGGFWLGLPRQFCKSHLPKRDEMITLIDEQDEEFETKYLADKNGLSGGWRGFSIDHQLVDGDAVVFHLITPTTFKVYIIRIDGEANSDSDGSEDEENDTESNNDSDGSEDEVNDSESNNDSDGSEDEENDSESNNDSDGSEDEENDSESNKKQEEIALEAKQLRSSSKRKRGGRK